MVANGDIATVGERARASIANPSYIIGVSAKIPRCEFGHEAAMAVSDDLPDNFIVLHLEFDSIGVLGFIVVQID